MGKPQYITHLETEVSDVKQMQRESNAVLQEIKICLSGTEFEQHQSNGKGGGLVRRLGRVETKVTAIQVWKTKMTSRDMVIYTIFAAVVVAIWTVLVKSWDTLFR